MKLEKKIKIAFDEWNLRSWHHPKSLSIEQGIHKDEYLTPRDKNDDNSQYTMADAVFTACFLSAMNRNCDIVGMANFAPDSSIPGAVFIPILKALYCAVPTMYLTCMSIIWAIRSSTPGVRTFQ